jgi:hypothetical protein
VTATDAPLAVYRRLPRPGGLVLTGAAALVVGVGASVGGLALIGAWLVALMVCWPAARTIGRSVGNHGRALLGFVGVCGVALALNAIAPAHSPGSTRLLAAAVLVVGMLPALWWVWRGGRGLPFLAAIGGLYALSFGAPVFLREHFTIESHLAILVPAAQVDRALWVSLLALGSLYAGWAIGRSPWRIDLSACARIHDRTALGLCVVGLLVYGFELAQPPSADVLQYVDFVASLTVLGFSVLYIRWAQRNARAAPWVLPAFVFILALRLLMGFGTGLNYQAFAALLPILLLAAVVRRRLPWKAVIAGLVLLVILQPVKSLYRTENESGTPYEKTASPLVSGARYLDSAGQVVGGGVSAQDTTDEFMKRFGYVFTFANVVDRTPREVPYWGRATLTPLLTKPIPRVVWPSKPEEATGQTFGHRYKYLESWDQTTSWNMPQLVEFYAAFGIWGVVLGMFLLGALYRLLFETVDGNTTDPKRAVGAAYVLSALLVIEGGTSQVVSGAIYRLLFLVALVWLIGRRPSARVSSQPA